jgi:hypothetical protein
VGDEEKAREKVVDMVDMIILRDFRDGVLYNAVIEVETRLWWHFEAQGYIKLHVSHIVIVIISPIWSISTVLCQIVFIQV